jgi:hypothetical protein
MMSPPIDLIANQLGKATRVGNGWSCLCPAHDDHNPSLSLSLSEDGTLLAHCYAGCSFPGHYVCPTQKRDVGKERFS